MMKHSEIKAKCEKYYFSDEYYQGMLQVLKWLEESGYEDDRDSYEKQKKSAKKLEGLHYKSSLSKDLFNQINWGKYIIPVVNSKGYYTGKITDLKELTEEPWIVVHNGERSAGAIPFNQLPSDQKYKLIHDAIALGCSIEL
ncbi:MAG: hypothetical protein ACOCQD_01055 [archaeon]